MVSKEAILKEEEGMPVNSNEVAFSVDPYGGSLELVTYVKGNKGIWHFLYACSWLQRQGSQLSVTEGIGFRNFL